MVKNNEDMIYFLIFSINIPTLPIAAICYIRPILIQFIFDIFFFIFKQFLVKFH